MTHSKQGNRLKLLHYLPPEGSGRLGLYACACGAKVKRLARLVERGLSRSCGCLRRDVNRGRRTHGATGTPMYRAWHSMIDRCHNPNNTDYALYGARGIKVCRRWRESFSSFLEDLGARPEGRSLDRIDNNKGYTASNTRWATPTQQANNRSSVVRLRFRGRCLTLRQWSEATGIPYSTLRSRHRAGWSASQTLTRPVGRHLTETT